jgi:hypothetical protein
MFPIAYLRTPPDHHLVGGTPRESAKKKYRPIRAPDKIVPSRLRRPGFSTPEQLGGFSSVEKNSFSPVASSL